MEREAELKASGAPTGKVGSEGNVEGFPRFLARRPEPKASAAPTGEGGYE